MKRNRGYRVLSFSRSRQMMAAALRVSSERQTIRAITEADITEPRRLMREHRERTGEGLTLTAYVVACLARAVAEHPRLNPMRKGRKLFVFDDVTLVTLVERAPEGERVVGVSNVGMFGDGAGWGLAPSAATLGVTVGGIAKRPVVVGGRLEEREHLCLTVSFDHDIVDGAPAARFTSRFLELLASGDALRDAVAHGEQLAKA